MQGTVVQPKRTNGLVVGLVLAALLIGLAIWSNAQASAARCTAATARASQVEAAAIAAKDTASLHDANGVANQARLRMNNECA